MYGNVKKKNDQTVDQNIEIKRYSFIYFFYRKDVLYILWYNIFCA